MPQKRLDASDDTVRLTIRVTKSQTLQLDRLRGKMSRSEYLRSLFPAEVELIEEPQQARAIVIKTRHLHRYKRVGDPVGHHKGVPIYLHECECGATKEDT